MTTNTKDQLWLASWIPPQAATLTKPPKVPAVLPILKEQAQSNGVRLTAHRRGGGILVGVLGRRPFHTTPVLALSHLSCARSLTRSLISRARALSSLVHALLHTLSHLSCARSLTPPAARALACSQHPGHLPLDTRCSTGSSLPEDEAWLGGCYVEVVDLPPKR